MLAQAVAATRYYAGYANLEVNDDVDPPLPAIDADTEISDSEWALIKPLFMLYFELERAIQLKLRAAWVLTFLADHQVKSGKISPNIQMEMPQRTHSAKQS
ncbi:MAG: hypothetical protein IPP22_09410 [Nitrosomonas sp.]|nr:hypothetical protein [Nitrosomonas sp.]